MEEGVTVYLRDPVRKGRWSRRKWACPPSSVETIWTNLVDAAAFLILGRFTPEKGGEPWMIGLNLAPHFQYPCFIVQTLTLGLHLIGLWTLSTGTRNAWCIIIAHSGEWLESASHFWSLSDYWLIGLNILVSGNWTDHPASLSDCVIDREECFQVAFSSHRIRMVVLLAKISVVTDYHWMVFILKLR